MKCAFCERRWRSAGQMAEEASPSFVLEGEPFDGPVCESCAGQFFVRGEDGELVAREEFEAELARRCDLGRALGRLAYEDSGGPCRFPGKLVETQASRRRFAR